MILQFFELNKDKKLKIVRNIRISKNINKTYISIELNALKEH